MHFLADPLEPCAQHSAHADSNVISHMSMPEVEMGRDFKLMALDEQGMLCLGRCGRAGSNGNHGIMQLCWKSTAVAGILTS